MYLAVLDKNVPIELALLGKGENSKVVALLKWLIVGLCSLISRHLSHKIAGNRGFRD